ncbi:hypothetical protein D3C73_522660 [compost metagenome]
MVRQVKWNSAEYGDRHPTERRQQKGLPKGKACFERPLVEVCQQSPRYGGQQACERECFPVIVAVIKVRNRWKHHHCSCGKKH